jgi:dihydroflavonol-4-reductase
LQCFCDVSAGRRAVKAAVTGATGFVGGHVARLLGERGDDVTAVFRNPERAGRLRGLDVREAKADVLDRASLRRAFRGSEVVFHTAGFVGSRPEAHVWRLNALAPRLVVEAAAAEAVRRVVLTSSVAGIGAAPAAEMAEETDVYRGEGMVYGDSKHEGEAEAFAAGARLGVEVVTVNPAYVLGVPVDRSQPGETSTRIVGNYLLGRLPAVVDGGTNVVDVLDVAAGHVLAAEDGEPGERYILGGANMSWVELIDRIAALSGVHHPVVVLPVETAWLARAQSALSLPGVIAPEGILLMAQNWRASSRKARRELGYDARPLEETLRATVGWYGELIDRGVFASRRPSALSLASAGMRAAQRVGVVAAARGLERYTGRRLVAGG